MSDDQAREMRPETTSEHIARDMREGRFPEQSERQMVPVLASLPHEIQVWRSMDALDHTGTWSTTRYPAEAVTYISKADAQAAVALAYETAADLHAKLWRETSGYKEAQIRALADADGLAAVEALRAEAYREGWRFAYRQCEATGSVPDPDYKAADLAPTPPDDTWHERRTMLPDGDARKGEG